MESNKTYQRILETLIEHIENGVLIINRNGDIIHYNSVMSTLEKTPKKDVIGQSHRKVFSHIPEERSTLHQALDLGQKTEHLFQTFTNQQGKEVTTINTTVPVTDGKGNTIAAIEIANDITRFKKMSDEINSMRSHLNNAPLKIRTHDLDDLIGNNPAFRKVIDRAKVAAQNSAPVLIYGATGTGKELFAQGIHYYSDRRNKPFLAQNCAALPDSLLEGILFGTAKGGFTGAVDKKGLFEQANGGTLLLDEVSAMPYELQSKLLRILQEHYVRRVGGSKDIPIDVRIIATLNEDAETLISSGRLRRDLYHRLKIISLSIPPLKDRKDDIPLLANSFLIKYSEEQGKQLKGFEQEALDWLVSYHYPGNVRELENMIHSAVSFTEDHAYISLAELECDSDGPQQPLPDVPDMFQNQNLDDYIQSIEKSLIVLALEDNGYNISKTARQLGIKRQTLQYKLAKHQIASK